MTPEWLVHDPKSEREEPAAPTRGRDIIQRNAKGEVWRGLPSMGRELEGAGRSPAPSWGEFERGGLPPFHKPCRAVDPVGMAITTGEKVASGFRRPPPRYRYRYRKLLTGRS